MKTTTLRTQPERVQRPCSPQTNSGLQRRRIKPVVIVGAFLLSVGVLSLLSYSGGRSAAARVLLEREAKVEVQTHNAAHATGQARSVTANIVVNDPGGGKGGPGCKLRDAVQAAITDTAQGGCPAGSGDDIIQINPEAITLTERDNNDHGANGLFPITNGVTIIGNGTTIQRAANAEPFRFFYVAPTGRLELRGVYLENGYARGGAGGKGPSDDGGGGGGGAGLGGAIYNRGTLTILNSAMGFNTAEGGAGGEGGRGVPGTNDNLAGGGGGGGGLSGAGGNARQDANDHDGGAGGGGCGAMGGGVGGDGGGEGGGFDVAGTNSNGFSGGAGGSAEGGDGGRGDGSDATARNGRAGTVCGGGGGGGKEGNGGNGGEGAGGGGGGEDAPSQQSDGDGNGGSGGFGGGGGGGGESGRGGNAGFGGGGGGAGSGHAAHAGGGGLSGGNGGNADGGFDGGAGGGGGAGLGGAIFNQDGTVTLTNVTISGNSTRGGAGGAGYGPGNQNGGMGQALGGGLYSYNGSLTINNSTFSGNGGLLGGGIFVYRGSTSASITLHNTIVANSSGNDCFVDANGGALAQAGAYNLIESNGSGGNACPGVLLTADPNLGPFIETSLIGDLPTHYLNPGSPAIDQGLAAGGATTDQRGRRRPVDFVAIGNSAGGDGSDIGAYEEQDGAPPTINCPTDITTSPASGACNATVSYTVTASDDTAPAPTVECSPPSGQTFPPGTTTVNCTARDSAGKTTNCSFKVTVNSSPPNITTQPANQTVPVGGTATFTVAASGNPAPTVQWQRSTDGGANFENVAGATNTTLTLQNVTAAQNGNRYRTVFTNPCGTATTTAAMLTVSGGCAAPALNGELSEGNACNWGTFASDNAPASVSDDATRVTVGAYSIKFTTASGFDTGVKYPAAGNAHWDLTGKTHFTFWTYAENNNQPTFQGNQPVLVLKTAGGSYRYEPQGELMTVGQWRQYFISLAGDGAWVRTTTGSPTLADVNQFEIHQDTWGYGFVIYYDGVGFVTVPKTPEDGDWSVKTISLTNTPEAALMARTGDIDNLNFGFPSGFNPFSGASTPVHAYPWQVDASDPAGTDRIFVVTSYNGNPPRGQDGYTGTTSRPANNVQSLTLNYQLNGLPITSAILQMFVDDFQASVWGAVYQVRLDGVRAPFLEEVINALEQTGPISKMISARIPNEFIPLLADGRLEITIDDLTTGAGDGYAIDFAKLLINPRAVAQTGTIMGLVTDSATNAPLAGALLSAAGVAEAQTGSDGRYTLTNVPAGAVVVRAAKPGFATQVRTTDLLAGQTVTLNFALTCPPPNITSHPANQTTTVGGSATFTAAASGTPAPTVQWQVSTNGTNFTDIAGATNTTLTIANVSLAQNGYRYRAIFSNACGTATSNTATLTVDTALTNTLLLLPFDNSLVGAEGETPTQATGVSFESGVIGQGVLVDGADMLRYATAGNFNAAAGTVEFWIKPRWNGNDNINYTFFSVGNSELILTKDGANNFRFVFKSDDSEGHQGYGLGAWEANQWHHVAVTWTVPGTMKTYFDGQLKISHSSSAQDLLNPLPTLLDLLRQ